MEVREAHGQGGFAVALDWGPTGAAALVAGPPAADLAVVVDVFSFTTTLSLAVEQGVRVHPYRWRDARAGEYAAARRATLAVGRFEAGDGVASSTVTLSPAAMARSGALDGIERLVLPSPNGSTIAAGLADGGAQVVGACLRNAPAVAAWLAPAVLTGSRVAVVAAGERWPDGSLRPAVEDLWGAGAVLAALRGEVGSSGFSPEALQAADAFDQVGARLGEVLRGCAGGRELAAVGFAPDVEVAAAYDVSAVVPVLVDDAFVAAAPR